MPAQVGASPAAVALVLEQEVEAALERNALDSELWRADVLQEWAWNPTVYTALSGGALYSLLARDYAPLEQRIVAFLGAVGGDALALVHGSRSAPPAEGRWEIVPRVAFRLPSASAEEADLELHLDAVLPRVVELFEARTPKGKAILAEEGGAVKVVDDEDGRRLVVADKDEEREYPLPRRARLRVAEGDIIEPGTLIVRSILGR